MRSVLKTAVCSKCGQTCCYWIAFDSLEGDPKICESCIALALGLTEVKLKKQLVEGMERTG